MSYEKLRKHIKSDGFLIAAFPNIGHWSVVEDLLHGRWDETPSGIFCVTHIRFGTRNTWNRWFEKSGWKIIRWESEYFPVTGPINQFLTGWNGIDRDSLDTLRYRVIASP